MGERRLLAKVLIPFLRKKGGIPRIFKNTAGVLACLRFQITPRLSRCSNPAPQPKKIPWRLVFFAANSAFRLNSLPNEQGIGFELFLAPTWRDNCDIETDEIACFLTRLAARPAGRGKPQVK